MSKSLGNVISPQEIIRQEHQAQAALNVSVRNIITSMRLILELDWKEPNHQHIQWDLEQSRMIEDQIVELQCDRTGITRVRWEEMAETGQKISGVRFFADGALTLNIVDEVVAHYPLFPE